MDYGIDTNRTFGLKELLIFTDQLDIPQTYLTRQCNIQEGQYPCLEQGCYTADQVIYLHQIILCPQSSNYKCGIFGLGSSKKSIPDK